MFVPRSGQPTSLKDSFRPSICFFLALYFWTGAGTEAVCLAQTTFLQTTTHKLRVTAYEHTTARLALRRANVTEEARLHVHCRRDTGVRHWRQHGDLQRGACSATTPVAVP